MTQWLGALVGLTEDLSSVRSIYMEAYKQTPWRYSCSTQTYM